MTSFNPQAPDIRTITGHDGLAPAMTVRGPVFVVEQGVPPEEEQDSFDAASLHALAEIDGRIVGTGRLVLEGELAAHIGRIAVLPEYRHRGIATRIIAELEQHALSHGFTELTLHAQTYVTELYEKSGYSVSGPGFIEAGIPHLPMTKRL